MLILFDTENTSLEEYPRSTVCKDMYVFSKLLLPMIRTLGNKPHTSCNSPNGRHQQEPVRCPGVNWACSLTWTKDGCGRISKLMLCWQPQRQHCWQDSSYLAYSSSASRILIGTILSSFLKSEGCSPLFPWSQISGLAQPGIPVFHFGLTDDVKLVTCCCRDWPNYSCWNSLGCQGWKGTLATQAYLMLTSSLCPLLAWARYLG